MKSPLHIAMASAIALTTAAPAFAQYYQPTPQYQRDLNRYDRDRANYEYNRGDYEAARVQYERDRSAWERSRADYDRRYGYGAYVRRYGPAPTWDTARYGAYDSRYSNAYDANRYGSNSAYSAGMTCNNNNSTVTAGAIGAIAGALLGSNVAARNARTEGAVLGALVGGGVGAAGGALTAPSRRY